MLRATSHVIAWLVADCLQLGTSYIIARPVTCYVQHDDLLHDVWKFTCNCIESFKACGMLHSTSKINFCQTRCPTNFPKLNQYRAWLRSTSSLLPAIRLLLLVWNSHTSFRINIFQLFPGTKQQWLRVWALMVSDIKTQLHFFYQHTPFG